MNACCKSWPGYRLCAIVAATAMAFASGSVPGSAQAQTGSQAAKKAIAGAAAKSSVVTTSLKPTTLDMPNPERGWYGFGEDLQLTTDNRLKQLYGEGYRMVFATVNLWQSRMSPLPQDTLDSVQRGFDRYRRAGLKVLLRVVYNYEANSPDAPLQVVLMHLNQLKPVIAANTDVIAYVQAGLVGAWGEWHSSTNNLTQPAAKAAIRDALLAAIPPPLYVQFRFPRDVIQWLPRPLQAAQAFSPTPQARTASHNDCFMSSPNDVGTYKGDDAVVEAAERAYVKAQTEYTPYGGETCSGFGPNRQACTDILREGSAYHLTYLNRLFHVAFHNQWKAEGCFDEVSRSLGYRFQVDEVTHAATAEVGSEFEVTVNVRNLGWSRIYSPRRLVVTLRDADSGESVTASGDLDMRKLEPQGTTPSKVKVVFKLNEGLPKGRYTVAISMPDVGSKTKSDARYAVRFANDDDAARNQRWDAEQGRFAVGSSVTIR